MEHTSGLEDQKKEHQRSTLLENATGVGKQKTKLLQKWKKFFEDNKHQWPDYLDYIQIRAKEIAS